MKEGLLFILGLCFLLAGGNYLVKGSVGIAKIFKLSPMLIGIVVVGFGTSVPELLASLLSVVGEDTYAPGIAIGNVIGSNIANILLIIGLSAAIRPISQIKSPNLDQAFLVLSPVFFALAIWALASGKYFFFSLLSVIMTIAMIAYVFIGWKKGENQEQDDKLLFGRWKNPIFCSVVVLISIILMYLGSHQMIWSAKALAQRFGVGDTVIGLSIVAVGTSLPELVASVFAAFRKESEISVGNIIGSNIFNILFIPGITGIVATITALLGLKQFEFQFDPNIWINFTIMGAVTIFFAILLKIGKINKLCGMLFLAAYAFYIIFIW